MACFWPLFLVGCALAQAIDDGTEMLQVVLADSEQSSAISTWEATAMARDLLLLAAKLGETNGIGKAQTPPDTEDPGKVFRVWNTGLDLAIGALREAAGEQLRVANETAGFVEGFHAAVGPEGISISSATEGQLQEAEARIVDLLPVFEERWSRYVDVNKKSAERVHAFYASGEGSDTFNLNVHIMDMMSPAQGMSKIMDWCHDGKSTFKTAANTVEGIKEDLRDMRIGFLQLQNDVHEDELNLLLAVRYFSKIKDDLKSARGKDVLDKYMEAFELLLQMAGRTEHIIAMLGTFVVK